MSNIVIVTRNGKVDIVSCPEDIEVFIFDADENTLYLYEDKYICSVDTVNDDGTVNLTCVDSMDGSGDGRRFMNVPPEKVEWYADDGGFDLNPVNMDDDEEADDGLFA